MDTLQDSEHIEEIRKVHQLLAKNIDDLKYLALCNMRLDEDKRPSKDYVQLDVNRITDIQMMPTENLEEWVGRELAGKTVKQESSTFAHQLPGETLEQWVARQKIKQVKIKPSRTILDMAEQWLMNEAKKDLFAEIDAIQSGPEGLSSTYIRELGMNLITLADKLDRIYEPPGTVSSKK